MQKKCLKESIFKILQVGKSSYIHITLMFRTNKYSLLRFFKYHPLNCLDLLCFQVLSKPNSQWRVQVIGCLHSPFFLRNLSQNPALCGNLCAYLKSQTIHCYYTFFCLERMPRKLGLGCQDKAKVKKFLSS